MRRDGARRGIGRGRVVSGWKRCGRVVGGWKRCGSGKIEEIDA